MIFGLSFETGINLFFGNRMIKFAITKKGIRCYPYSKEQFEFCMFEQRIIKLKHFLGFINEGRI